MSDPTAALALAPIIAGLNGQVAYAGALMMALPAIAAAASLAYLGARFLDCATRQPEIMEPLTKRLLLIAALVDAGALLSIVFGVTIAFANPFASSIVALVG